MNNLHLTPEEADKIIGLILSCETLMGAKDDDYNDVIEKLVQIVRTK